MKSKQQKKWIKEIEDLEKSIPQWEEYLAGHRHDLINDSTIGFYQVAQKQEACKQLMDNIKKAKKRISDLNEKV